MLKNYTKKINEWDLDVEYQYIPAEDATYDYPGYGSHIEIVAIYLWNDEINTSTDEPVDMSDFFYEWCYNRMMDLEDEIRNNHENN